LRVLDAAGHEVRRFSSADTDAGLPADRYFEERWVGATPRLSTRAGAHRFYWDLRGPRPLADAYGYGMGAVDGDVTPLLPQGMLVAPGRYTLVLEVDGREARTPLDVVADPRVAVDAAALDQVLALSARIRDDLAREVVANRQIQAVRAQLDALAPKGAQDAALASALTSVHAALEPLVSGEGEQAPLNIGAIGGQLTALEADLEASDAAPTAPQRAVHADDAARLDRALQQWARIKADDLPVLDRALQAAHLPPIRLDAARPPVADAGASREIP
jgi:hypothetical protein